MSMPMIGREMILTQPDGTTVPVRAWGNQHHAVFRTLDGYPVIRNRATGYHEFAAVDAEYKLKSVGLRAGIDRRPSSPQATTSFSPWQMQTMARSNAGLPEGTSRWRVRSERKRRRAAGSVLDGLRAAPPSRETVGKFVGLCILVEFPDVRGTIDPKEVDRFLNSEGYTGFGNAGSVREYFRDVSQGKVEYTNIVTVYIRTKHARSYYTDPAVEQPVRTYELIGEALAQLRAEKFDFTRLTVDSENYVYAMNIYYAGECVNNWAEGLWPHCYNLDSPLEVAPGVKLNDYQITDMGDELTLGTICHENGHMICDFPDLYDYGANSAGAGDYCLMCGGGNANPKNPTHVGAYLKFRAGWANAVNSLTRGASVSIPARSNHFCLFQKDQREYFIFENRQQTGRDSALPSAGLAIWHVDEAGSNNNEQSTAASHYECALKQADGKYDLEHNTNYGDKADLFPNGNRSAFDDTTAPSSRWWNGQQSGLAIRNIVDHGSSISFNVV
jgi:M6 family metalloprotease-like protein